MDPISQPKDSDHVPVEVVVINRLIEKFQAWRDHRFLQRHGCRTWEHYDHKFDPDYDPRASCLKHYYHGYPYRHVIADSDHYCYRTVYDYGPGGFRMGYNDMFDWCQDQVAGESRSDILPLVYDCDQGYVIDETEGENLVVFAFKNSQDALMFALRWG